MTEAKNFNDVLVAMQAEVQEGEKGDNPWSSPPSHVRAEGKLSLNQINTCEALFQPRAIDEYASPDHIKTLKDAIRNNNGAYLDKLSVWWSGRRWYVIDGHHRLQAYKEAYANNNCRSIPVEVFVGTLDNAIEYSTRANVKDKLPMTKLDKLEKAWKFVCMGGRSKSDIQKITGVSKGTIDNMRTYHRQQVDQDVTKEDLLNSNWSDSYSKGRQMEYDDAYKDALAKDYAKKLRKVFGKELSRKPDIVALALEYYNPDLPKTMIENEWLEIAKKAVEEAATIKDNPDF